MAKKAFTDYPITALGDVAGERAPIRECVPINYDGDKYSVIQVEGILVTLKAGYIYTTPCRCGEGVVVPPKSYQVKGGK